MRKKNNRGYRKNNKIWKIVAIVLAGVLAVGGSVALFTGLSGKGISKYIDMDTVEVGGKNTLKDGVVVLNNRNSDEDSAVYFTYDAAAAGIYEVAFKTEATSSFYHELSNISVDEEYISQNRDYNDSYDLTGYSTMKTYVIMDEGENELKYTQNGVGIVSLSGIRVKQVAEKPAITVKDFTFESKATHAEGVSFGYDDDFGGACCVRYDGTKSDVMTATFTVTKDGIYDLDMIGSGVGIVITIKNASGAILGTYTNSNLLPCRANQNSEDSDTVGGWSSTQYIDLGKELNLEAGNYTVEITSTKSFATAYALFLTQQ